MLNPFRVLQLPVDASGQVIRKHQQKLRFDLNQSDWKGPKPMCLPMSPPPTGVQIQEAFTKLENPVERFLAELFWYWPVATGEFNFGLGAWSKWPGHENGAAGPHNIALFHLFSAIQKTESLVQTPTQASSPEDLDHWKLALSCWNGLLTKEEAMWHRLRARILEVGDPRLETDLIPTLRMSLVPSIEGVAINLLEKIFASRDQGTWSVMLKSVLTKGETSILSFPRQLITIPTKELDHADRVIKSALSRVEPISNNSAVAIKEWIVEVQSIGSMLWILEKDAGLPSDLIEDIRHARNDVLRKYTNALRSIFIDYHNETLDRVTCLAWLKLIDGWNIGGVEGGRIKEDISKLVTMQSEDENIERIQREIHDDLKVTVELPNTGGYTYWTVCVCCLKETCRMERWSRTEKQGNYQRTRSIELPYCDNCSNHRKAMVSSRRKAVFVLLLPMPFITYLLGRAGMEGIAVGLVGLILGGLAYIFARWKQWPAWAFKVSELEHGHAHRGEPVEIKSIGVRTTSIQFMNSFYGQRFAEMNNARCEGPWKYRKHTRGTNLLTGRSGREILAWAIIGAGVLGWACGAAGFEGQKESNIYSSNRYSPPSSPSESQSNSYSPAPTPSPTTYSPPPVYTRPSVDYRSAEKSRIEGLKSELRMLELELESKQSELENIARQIRSSKNSAESYSLSGNEYLYNSEVERHNSLVRRHESLRMDYNSYLSIYRMKLRTANDAIDRYNRGN